MQPKLFDVRRWMFATTLLIAFAAMAEDGPHPTITLREMPEALRAAWSHNLPDMNANSRCAVAFDSQVEQNRMVFKCSLYIAMAAEGARRAMRYCEESRVEKGIKSPCRLVKP